MPFEIVRNDIIKMRVDAVVNTANPKPLIGAGLDWGIHKAAGEKLLQARKEVGIIDCGDVAITPAFDLDAQYIIHAVGPIWQDGKRGEEQMLASCYRKALELATKHNCESIAFPLISTGNYGFPKPLALQIAVREFSTFLLKNEMQIYLVVFGNEALKLSEKLFKSVKSYIDENYIQEKIFDEYGPEGMDSSYSQNRRIRETLGKELKTEKNRNKSENIVRSRNAISKQVIKKDTLSFKVNETQHFPGEQRSFKKKNTHNSEEIDGNSNLSSSIIPDENWDYILKVMDAGFSETLLYLIDRSGKKDSEVYKKANVDRKLFSKIRNNKNYRPSKTTALAFAFALELDLEETKDFIARAGFALSHSSKFDIIVEYFLVNKNYAVFELNEVLFTFDQPLIGA